MKRNRIKKSKGFTLIELLIVIGILAVLAVTLLLALNPAEAQKRTRDTKRLRDAATLQAIINQYLESGAAILASSCNGTSSLNGAGCTTTGLGTAPQPCTANWLGINVCPYAQTVPVDPNNSQNRTFISGLTAGTGFTAATEATYRARVQGSDYEVNVRQEAEANRGLVNNDGGDAVLTSGIQWFEIFSNAPNLY